MLLSLYHDKPSSAQAAETFKKENVLERLKVLDSRARRKGLDSIDPTRNPLIGLGMEVNEDGRVTKNSYGVFNLSWQSAEHPEWPHLIMQELAVIRRGIRDTHGVPLRYLIWVGMGGSAEDKTAYNAIGLLKRGPRVYVLDSTDPAKMQAILDDMQRRSGAANLGEALKSTLVAGMALGMTSYEPVMNLEKLAMLYARYKVDSRPNFFYMTMPDSLLDQFGRKQGYRKVETQLDNQNGTAGRHSAPLTRGSLYSLGLASVDLVAWMKAAELGEEEIQQAWRLAAFLNTQAAAGRNKIVLLLPKQWSGIGVWTKQDFEESLGKREDFGLKIVVDEKPKLARYRAPKDAAQDRAFLAVQIKGVPHGDALKIAALRRAGYPVASITLQAPELSRYMQFIHYAVFGMGFLQNMNFVTQPSVELYKAITGRLHTESEKAGGIEKTAEWQAMHSSPRRAKFRSAVTLYYDRLSGRDQIDGADAAGVYASILKSLAGSKRIEYGELTFFGDMRYSARGRAIRKSLERAAERIFRDRLRMPVDVYEGPAMNHSYHEMIIGHGRCLSTVLLSEKVEKISAVEHTADYHRAQFLATQMALAERGRCVVSITLKDLEETSLQQLNDFFAQTAAALKTRKGR